MLLHSQQQEQHLIYVFTSRIYLILFLYTCQLAGIADSVLHSGKVVAAGVVLMLLLIVDNRY
jgi:hypothetical protein